MVITTIDRSGLELTLSINETKDELTIERDCHICDVYWGIVIRDKCLDPDCEGNKRLTCAELYKLLIEATGPDSNSIWHLENWAVKYSPEGTSQTTPVLTIWTGVDDPYGSMYNIVLRRK